jgi:putative methanogen marker protein 4
MSESILGLIEKGARKNHAKIAIGAGSERKGYSEKVIRAAAAADFADVTVVGKHLSGGQFEWVDSENVEKDLIGLLNKGSVDAVVRGSCSAALVLREIKRQLKPDRLGRIALLRAQDGYEFFFSPVGIDEGNSVEEKVFLIEEGVKLIRRFGVEPRVGVLSGGRSGDLGRIERVDKTIVEAKKTVDLIRGDGFSPIKNYNILVEDAVYDRANFIIGPDGVTGNLMFRSLVFLGCGKGFGAPMVGMEQVFVDTSRAGGSDEYVFALMMAGALA